MSLVTSKIMLYEAQNSDVYDPKAYLKVGRENVKQLVKNRILVCGCQGKY